ncbi:MAG: ornithine cyclodeaminase family protein, partial [Armatimonadota bacterium]
RALQALAAGEALMPLRSIMWLPERVGALGMMPAYLGEAGVLGLKVISVFPGNHGTEFDAHQGAVMLFDAKNGRPLAVIDATSITAIRTAAVSGVATRLLAREDAGDLALIGSGTQARTHLEAMRLARPLRRVRVWSRHRQHAAAFAEREGRRHGVGIEAVATAQQAVAGADLICTTTSSAEPVLQGEWIAPSAHINAVGSSVPFARELDTAAVVRSRLFVDRRESTINEAGDFLFPKKEGAIGDDHIRGEIGEVLLGRLPGRSSRDEITLFKSLGLAIEDLASAHHIYTKAVEKGLGAQVELGGSRAGAPTA